MAKRKPSAASQDQTKRRSAVNDSIVSSYLSKLEAALGDDRAFLPVFEALKADPEVRQEEAVALATKFVAKTAESTARAKALDRVLKRHSALASFRLKQRAMAGRSAA